MWVTVSLKPYLQKGTKKLTLYNMHLRRLLKIFRTHSYPSCSWTSKYSFLFYTLSFIIRCESYKVVQVESKSFFYTVFPPGHPPIIWPSLPGHFCPPLPGRHPGTALPWNPHHPTVSCPSPTTPAFDHTEPSLGHEKFPSSGWGPSWPHFLPNSYQPLLTTSSHLAFQPHLISTPDRKSVV